MDHFMNPRNVGVLENPDRVGKAGNPVCWDLMEMFIKVNEEKIDEIIFRTLGCSATIAISSMTTEMAKGKTLDEAQNPAKKTRDEKLGSHIH
jgi:nitrogen fixation protein NifU and related proteins